MGRLFKMGGLVAIVVCLALPAAAQATATASLDTVGGLLTVTGDASAEAIAVSDTFGSDIRIVAPGINDADDAGTDCSLSAGALECDSTVVDQIVVNAGDGADSLTDARSSSNDPLQLNGQGGDDTFASGSSSAFPTQNGGAGNDVFNGARGNVSGDDGNDTITASDSGPVGTLAGGAGDDVINNARGTVDGGDGNDTITTSTFGGVGSVDGGAGDDVLNGASGSLDGGDGNDTLNAAPGSFDYGDTGGPGNDVLNGNPKGWDSFSSEPGADTYSGGNTCQPTPPSEGRPTDVPDPDGCDGDSISYSGTAGVTVTLDNVANDGVAGEGDNVHSDIDSVLTGNGDDTLDASMTATGKSLHPGAGNDVVNGSAGDDELSGGNGSDTVNGNAGDDEIGSYEQIDPEDPAAQQAGNDTYNGGPGNDWMDAGSTLQATDSAHIWQQGSLGVDTFAGGDGEDTIAVSRTEYTKREPTPDDGSTVQTSNVGVSVSLDGVANDGFPGSTFTLAADFENVDTGDGNDTVVGNAGPNVLWTSGGNDTVDGGAGVDLISAGNGVDTITSRDLGFDKVDCGLAVDAPVQGDAGDMLHECEASSLTALPAPPDTTKPKSKLKAPKKVKSKSFRKSRTITIEVTPSEAAIIEATVYSGKAGAVGSKVLGKGRAGLKAGKRKIKVKFSKSVANALIRQARRKGKKGVAVTVTITTTDAAGLSSKANVTIRLVP